MSRYRYRTGGDEELSLSETDGNLIITRSWRDSEGRVNHRLLELPAAERQAAAQALAGDGWRLVPVEIDDGMRVDLIGRPLPVDPADVKVGDVVSVEADDGSWLVRGEVTELDPASPPYRFRLWIARHGHDGIWPRLTGATVRLVRRPEPESDPEQVEALADVLIKVDFDADTNETWLARELIRRGVTVRKER